MALYLNNIPGAVIETQENPYLSANSMIFTMKYSSLSFITLLAAVLAVSSAFTLRRGYVDRFAVNFNRSVNLCDGKFIPETDAETEFPQITNVTQFDAWTAANCDGNTSIICGVHSQVDNEEILETIMVTIRYGYFPEEAASPY